MQMIQLPPSSPPTTHNHNKSHPRAIAGGASRPAYEKVDWAVLVSQIKAGEESGLEQLYKLFSRGIRYYLRRSVGAAGIGR